MRLVVIKVRKGRRSHAGIRHPLVAATVSLHVTSSQESVRNILCTHAENAGQLNADADMCELYDDDVTSFKRARKAQTSQEAHGPQVKAKQMWKNQ
jgi:hypothetical protein